MQQGDGPLRLSSAAYRRRRRKARAQAERAAGKPLTAQAIASRHDHVTAAEDRPYAAKRQAMAVSPVAWLKARDLITEDQHSAAVGWARDWYGASLAPSITATLEPRIPGEATWTREAALDAYARYRWVQRRLTAPSWRVLDAVVLQEVPIATWLDGLRQGLKAARDRDAQIRQEILSTIDRTRGDERRTALEALDRDLAVIEVEIHRLTATIVDRAVAMRQLRAGLDELVRLRAEYRREGERTAA